MTPKQLEFRIKAAEAKFMAECQEIADEFYRTRVKPYCQEKQLSFTMMNGLPRFINAENEYVVLPRFFKNICDHADSNGNRIMWLLPDYKYKPSVDFDAADTKWHDKVYSGRPLASLVFSPILYSICR